jgi:ferredoxin
MKVRVDPARCQGHTLCTIPAPDVFLLDEEEGHAHVQDENADVQVDREDAVRKAAATCPERAIIITT